MAYSQRQGREGAVEEGKTRIILTCSTSILSSYCLFLYFYLLFACPHCTLGKLVGGVFGKEENAALLSFSSGLTGDGD